VLIEGAPFRYSKGPLAPQRGELTHHEGHEEHEAFFRRDAEALRTAQTRKGACPLFIERVDMDARLDYARRGIIG